MAGCKYPDLLLFFSLIADFVICTAEFSLHIRLHPVNEKVSNLASMSSFFLFLYEECLVFLVPAAFCYL